MENKKCILRLLLALMVGLFSLQMPGCAKKVDLETERAEILRIDKEWASVAAEGRDLERIVSFWADDAIVFPPRAPAVVGKDAIRQYVAGSLEIPGFSVGWESTQVTVSRSGDFAYAIGKNHFTFNDTEGNPITSYGKSVTVWRKDADGNWKCVIDIWNEEPSPESQATSSNL